MKIIEGKYRGCGKVFVAIKDDVVVDMIYKDAVVLCRFFDDFCKTQGWKSCRMTSRRLREFNDFKRECRNQDLKKAKEEFVKKNEGLMILEGIASCGEIYINV